MRWLLTIAALGTLAALPLAQAQMRGARMPSGGGGHVAGPGRFGSAPAPRQFAAPGPRFNGGFPGGGTRFNRPFVPGRGPFVGGSRVGFSSSRFGFNRDRRFFDRRFFDGRFRHFRFFDRPFLFSGGCIHGPFFGGFPCRHFFFNNAFVWGYAPYYADYSYGDYSYPGYSYPGYAYGAQQQPAAADNSNSNNVELAYEVGRLSEEVAQLRQEKASVRTDEDEEEQQPAKPAPAAAPVRPAKSESNTLATLVFRDGHRSTVKNYAVVGNTLWILNDRSARKVSLSDLDLEATQRVNEENGVELHLRASSAPH